MEPNWIMQRSFLTPNRIGLRFGEESWTFQQLHTISVNYAKKIVALGVKPRERVAILAKSTPDLVHIIYGCMQAQVEIVFLNHRLTPKELAYQLEDANVRLLIVDCSFEHVISFENMYTFSQLLEVVGEETFIPTSEWDASETISIMYTSGTTGFPKGVRQTVENHRMSALSSALNIGIRETDCWLCAVPIFHISGFSILIRSLIYGMTVALYEKFDEVAITKEITTGTVTHISVVSVMLERMLSYMETHNLKTHPNFQLILAGGGPIPVAFLQRAIALKLPVAQTYGMTETSSQTCTLSAADAMRKIGSAGKPLFFYQVRINKVTEPLEIGEICIRGPQVTPGYIGQFAHVQSIVDGWLHTGDIGYLDEEGYLYVVDRRSDLIISGGENVYPAEIENVLLSHPAVLEAGVCGKEHATWGHVPIAFIVKKLDVSEEQLIQHCSDLLAKYKIPKRIIFVENLPRNGANKLMRHKLKELL